MGAAGPTGPDTGSDTLPYRPRSTAGHGQVDPHKPRTAGAGTGAGGHAAPYVGMRCRKNGRERKDSAPQAPDGWGGNHPGQGQRPDSAGPQAMNMVAGPARTWEERGASARPKRPPDRSLDIYYSNIANQVKNSRKRFCIATFRYFACKFSTRLLHQSPAPSIMPFFPGHWHVPGRFGLP